MLVCAPQNAGRGLPPDRLFRAHSMYFGSIFLFLVIEGSSQHGLKPNLNLFHDNLVVQLTLISEPIFLGMLRENFNLKNLFSPQKIDNLG